LRKRWDDDPGRHGRERRAQANRCGSVESGLDLNLLIGAEADRRVATMELLKTEEIESDPNDLSLRKTQKRTTKVVNWLRDDALKRRMRDA
jgi:hypothetical protein